MTNPKTADDLIVPMQDASLDIWDKKYRLKDKQGRAIDATLDDTFRRVANALAGQEEKDSGLWEERFLWALRNGAIPAGRIMSNAGAQTHKPSTSLINCTVSGTLPDSMDGILGKAHEAGMTLKAGCGIGYEFSTLRPRGAFVAGAGAFTSGPLSFMDIFDKVCQTVSSAGGRRGAQMATFDIHHPDVLDFIRAKRENGRLRQFNLSLLIGEDFLEAVRRDGTWPLSFPVMVAERDEVDLNNPNQVVWRSWPAADRDRYITREDGFVACRVYRTIKAKHLWNQIMASTYDFAEPGFIMVDRVNAMNNNWFCENIRASNPCVTGDTWVHTSRGPRRVHDLLGRRFKARVDGRDHWTGEQGFFRTDSRQVYAIQTREGYRIRLTDDHRLKCLQGKTTEWRAAGDLLPGDRILLNDHAANTHWSGALTMEEGYLLGVLIGDGSLDSRCATLMAWPKTGSKGARARMKEVLRCMRTLAHRRECPDWNPVKGRDAWRMTSTVLRDLAFGFGMKPSDKTIHPVLEKASSDGYRGFLRGFFDSDASVQGTPSSGASIRLSQSDLPRLRAVQRMLLRLGIRSCLYMNRRAAGLSSPLPDGKGGRKRYPIKAQHDLSISGESMRRFALEIGFADLAKAKRLKKILDGYRRPMSGGPFYATVVYSVPAGFEDVYDVQVPGINAFDGDGFHAHNCGEQMLPPYGSCLLGSINLTAFVRSPFVSGACFDWSTYRKVARIFTRMLDNVVELNGLPLHEQRDEILRKRRHGMGFMGLGSALAMLNMTYGDAASLDFASRVTMEMAVTGWREGLELAREKGPAPIMLESFEVVPEMLALRPEMTSHGYRLGDSVQGKALHARYSRYMQKIAAIDAGLVNAIAAEGARFTHHTSIAPTGTIALSFGNNASNGIEPSFAHKYSRNIIREGRKTKEKVEVCSYELLAYRHLVDPTADPDRGGLPDCFMGNVADAISPEAHLDVQAAVQEWVDSSISKTINVPQDYPFEKFQGIYSYAARKGLKGCTTFRFNPDAFQGVLVKEADLANTEYEFTLENGEILRLKGNEEVEYDGEVHTAANLFDALKEGYYGRL